MKSYWIAIVLLGLASSIQGEERYPEVQAIPPEKVTKAWKAEITLSGTLEEYTLNGANSVTLIGGFSSFAECQKQAVSIAQTLMSAAKSVGRGSWSDNGPSVSFGCHKEDMYMQ